VRWTRALGLAPIIIEVSRGSVIDPRTVPSLSLFVAGILVHFCFPLSSALAALCGCSGFCLLRLLFFPTEALFTSCTSCALFLAPSLFLFSELSLVFFALARPFLALAGFFLSPKCPPFFCFAEIGLP
jgi:hypothetical protein